MDLLKSTNFKHFLKLAQNNENILACILFGSYAKGNYKLNSDIDICIIKRDINQIEGFEELMGFENIDLTFFNRLSQVMKFKVLTQGKILILNDKIKYKKIKRNQILEFQDFYPRMEKTWSKVLKNVAN